MTENVKTCTKHVGASVTYDLAQYEECPLCAAEDKIADYETMD